MGQTGKLSSKLPSERPVGETTTRSAPRRAD